jgi:putative protease
MEVEVGKITHYFGKIGVAAVQLTDTLKKDDLIHIKGHTTDIEQKVEVMQIEHEKIDEASKGQTIGIKVKDYVREHDVVYRVDS